MAQSPGVAFERAAYLRRKGMDKLALAEAPYFPHEVATNDQGDRIWDERRHLVLAALRANDAHAAYAAAADSGPDGRRRRRGLQGTTPALDRAHQAQTTRKKAAKHFAAPLEKIGTSPVTKGRALYWEGRAADARGDKAAATDFYTRAARRTGDLQSSMLAGEKIGSASACRPISGRRSRHELRAVRGRDSIQATRLFDPASAELFRTFVLNLDDILPTAEDEAQLIDLARGYGEMDTSPRRPRRSCATSSCCSRPTDAQCAGQRRRTGADPIICAGNRFVRHSSVAATGMMQLMPSTAKIWPARSGLPRPRSASADYNVKQAAYLGRDGEPVLALQHDRGGL